MEARWIAHAPQLLGCYAEEDSREAAIAAAPVAIAGYCERLRRYGELAPVLAPPVSVHIEEMALEWVNPADPDHTVNAFFASDAAPLTVQEVELAARLLQWNRQEQRAAFAGRSLAQLEQPVEDGWSIVDILDHIGRGEWWYLTRLDLAPSAPAPAAWEERQDLARQRLLEVLPGLVGDTRIVLKDAEVWSPRKMLRRALWHEPDHTQHILQFLNR
jgi:predicted RNase H-like HicB family nuclease